MPLDRLVLILVIVFGAAAFSLWLGALVFAIHPLGPGALLILTPVALAGYVLWRVIVERQQRSEDDRYEKVDH